MYDEKSNFNRSAFTKKKSYISKFMMKTNSIEKWIQTRKQ